MNCLFPQYTTEWAIPRLVLYFVLTAMWHLDLAFSLMKICATTLEGLRLNKKFKL